MTTGTTGTTSQDMTSIKVGVVPVVEPADLEGKTIAIAESMPDVDKLIAGTGS